ncbi:hypothetical protein C8F01DRAFT_1369281 [Mycena amicta]|nr:hypothetical protein C8F01DRAFT_1369281 [Mycena amicta]
MPTRKLITALPQTTSSLCVPPSISTHSTGYSSDSSGLSNIPVAIRLYGDVVSLAREGPDGRRRWEEPGKRSLVRYTCHVADDYVSTDSAGLPPVRTTVWRPAPLPLAGPVALGESGKKVHGFHYVDGRSADAPWEISDRGRGYREWGVGCRLRRHRRACIEDAGAHWSTWRLLASTELGVNLATGYGYIVTPPCARFVVFRTGAEASEEVCRG